MSESLDRYEVDVLDDLSATYSNAAGRWCKIIVDIKFHCTGRLYARGRILNFSPSKQCHQPAIIPRATFYLRENRPYNLCHLRSPFLHSILSFVSVFPCFTARTWPYNSSCFMLCASYTYRLRVLLHLCQWNVPWAFITTSYHTNDRYGEYYILVDRRNYRLYDSALLFI